jgi:hypothetical protein
MGENRGSSIVFRLLDRRNSQGAMGESAGRLFCRWVRRNGAAQVLFIRRETRYMSVLILRP